MWTAAGDRAAVLRYGADAAVGRWGAATRADGEDGLIRAVFWDNDGVLVDTEKIYYQATRELLLTTGVELTEELFRRISLVEGRSSFILAAERGVPQEEIDRLHAARNRRYTELLEGGVRIMEGVEEALGALRGNVVQGVVTSSRKEHFDTMHRGTGLLSNFDFILTREDFTLSKPDPEPYRKAMERCRLTPDECLVVEDSPRGLESARDGGHPLPRGSPCADAGRRLCRRLAGARELPRGPRGGRADRRGNPSRLPRPVPGRQGEKIRCRRGICSLSVRRAGDDQGDCLRLRPDPRRFVGGIPGGGKGGAGEGLRGPRPRRPGGVPLPSTARSGAPFMPGPGFPGRRFSKRSSVITDKTRIPCSSKGGKPTTGSGSRR